MLPSAAHIWVCFGAFLPRDAMHKRSLCRCAVFVRPSIFLYVTFVYSFKKREKKIFHFFVIVGSHTILVFDIKRYGNIPTKRALNAGGVGKSHDF